MSQYEEIIKKKRILRENGYNVALDNSWGPALQGMWDELSKKQAEQAQQYYIQANGQPIQVKERHDELRPGQDDADRAKILSDAKNREYEARINGDPKKAQAIISKAEQKFNEAGQEHGNETKWYNPLTWGMDYATNIVGQVPLSERGEYFKNHPWIAQRYNDAERYRQGHDFANGAGLIGNTALLAGSAGAGLGLRGIGEAVGVGTRLLKTGYNAASKALGTQWKLARNMPWRYAFNAAKDFLVVPTVAGGAVNYGTKLATDQITGGYGVTFDEGVSQALGVPEIIGSGLNPGYNFKVFQPNWKQLWRAGHVDGVYLNNLRQAGPGISLERRSQNGNIQTPISEMRDAARAIIDDIKRNPEQPILVKTNKNVFVPSQGVVDHSITVSSPFDPSHTADFRIVGHDGIMYNRGTTMVNAQGEEVRLPYYTMLKKEKREVTVPLQTGSYDAITSDYKNFAEDISRAVGDDGILSGSVQQFADGWFPGSFDGTGFNPAHDIEFLTTEARLPALKEKLGIGDLDATRDFVRSGKSSRFPQFSGGDTDIQLILEKNGKATGKAAHEVYAYLHPEEYARMHNQYTIANKNAVPDIKWEDTELPISAEDLYTELRNSGENGQRILMDVLGSQKEKHVNRAKALFMNPEKLHQAQVAYDRQISSVIEGYQNPLTIYKNFNFDNIESNKQLIQAVTGLSEQDAQKLATNKEYVQDIFKMFINNKTIGFRRTSIPENGGDVITGLTHGAAGYGHGQASGPGLNMTRVAPVGDQYGDFISVLQNDLTYNPEKVTNTKELLQQLQHLSDDVSELYHDNAIKDFAQDAVRISQLAKERDQPIYLTPGHNYSGLYLGMVHDMDVPRGLYVNPDRVEVPGGPVVESLRSLTDGVDNVAEMSQKELADYLKQLRQSQIDILTGKKRANFKISLDFGNVHRMFPFNQAAQNSIEMKYGVSNLNFNDNDALVRSAKILSDAGDLEGLYWKSRDVPMLANLTDTEVAQAEALRRAFIRRNVNISRDEADRLYRIWTDRRDYTEQTPFYNQFKRSFNWSPGMGLGTKVIDFGLNDK